LSIGNYLFYNQTNPTGITYEPIHLPENIVTISPNPFNNKCRINIYSPSSIELTINIFDIRGRLIKNLANKQINSGNHQFEWNALDNNGNGISSGTYFYVVELGDKKISGKLLLLK